MNYTEDDVSYYLAYHNTNNYFDNDIATINSSEIPDNGTLDAIDWYYYHGQWGTGDHHFIHENNDNCEVYVKRNDSGPSEMAWDVDWMAIANCVHPSPYWNDYSDEFQKNYYLNKYESPTKMQENNLWQWSNFTWQNPEISNGTQVGWRIYFIDTSGNVNCTDIMNFSIGQEITSMKILLYPDWNFVSLPFNQSINKTDIIVKYNGYYYTWQEAVANDIILGFIYDWNRYTQNFNLVDSLRPGFGYWIYAYHNCELWAQGLSGFITDNFITDLNTNWNTIGLPDNKEVHKENLTVYYNGTEYSWQEAVDNDTILNFIYLWNEINQYYQLTDVLIPGKACWMYAFVDCRLLKPV